MQKPTSKKPTLHGAAAESHRQAEAGKGSGKAGASKSADAGRKTAKPSSEDENQTDRADPADRRAGVTTPALCTCQQGDWELHPLE